MTTIRRYLINVSVIPEKKQDVIDAVLAVNDLKYGNFKWVYFVSGVGTEYYNVLPEDGQNVPESQVNSNPTVQIEFSIPEEKEQLKAVLLAIQDAHPWKEPVVRISQIQETRVS